MALSISPKLAEQVVGLASDLSALFSNPDYIPGCKVVGVDDINQYASNNGWIECLASQHNRQRVRYKGNPAGVAVDDYVDVVFYPDISVFICVGAGGTGAITTGGAPVDAQYLTLATAVALTAERVFTPVLPLVGTDNGAGLTYDLSINTATESAAGVAEIATQAEVTTGTDDVRYITPLKLATRLATIDAVKVSELWESDGGSIVVDVDATGNVVFNDASVASRNWRMESNNNANMFNLLGNSDVVIIGGATQQTSGSQLEVHNTSDGYVTLYNSGDTSAERGMYLRFNHSGGIGAQIGFYRPISSSNGGNIIIATQPGGGGSLIPAMYIDSNQRIGIGGTPSAGIMHFQGSLASGGLAAMYLDPTTSGSGTMYGLRVVGQVGVSGFFGIGIHGGTNLSTNWIASLWVGNEANRPGISIGYGSSTKAPTHGIIMAGNAGFKTSGPTHTLQLGDDDAAKTTTTTWTTTSDGRAKRNIKRYGRGLADVLALPAPVEFEFNGEFTTPEGQRGVGFVAQDLAKVAPEMIRNLTRDGAAALGVNPNDLLYMLVNAVRDLAAEIESLKGAE